MMMSCLYPCGSSSLSADDGLIGSKKAGAGPVLRRPGKSADPDGRTAMRVAYEPTPRYVRNCRREAAIANSGWGIGLSYSPQVVSGGGSRELHDKLPEAVSWSLADAEPAENAVEQVVRVDGPD